MIFGKKKYSRLADEELMRLVEGGEVSALDELYLRYGRRLLYYLFRMLGKDESKAQDFLHDIFLKIIEKPELYVRGRSFSTWIFSIAHNMCKNEYRSREVRSGYSIAPDESTFQGEEIMEGIDREAFAAALDLELESLDHDARTAFLLRHREHLSIREISEIVGCPEGTVKSRLFNTARKLSARLRQYNPNITSIDYE